MKEVPLNPPTTEKPLHSPDTRRERAPAAPGTPRAASPDLDRARWVEWRVHELPALAAFFYNLLLDRLLPDQFKEQVFGVLWYIVEEDADLIPRDDLDLGGIDAAVIALRCVSELVARLPQAALAVYEEVLHRQGVAVRAILPDVPARFGEFHRAIDAIYRARIARTAPLFKNAVETGFLVRLLTRFLGQAPGRPWTLERLERVEAFLSSFRLPEKRK
jgi:hypothetical protein